MGKPRIIFVNRVYWPDARATAQLLTDLAEGLVAKGWEVHVVTAGYDDSPVTRRGVSIHRTGTPEKHGGIASRLLFHRRYLQAARRRLSDLLQPGDTVVALTDPPMLGAMVAEVAYARGARVVHWIQDVYPEIAEVHFGLAARLVLTFLKSRRDCAWTRAALCVTLGQDMADFVRSRQVAPASIRVVPNWAPRELHDQAAAPAIVECRRRWGCHDKFVVAYSGNLGRVHEFATLLDAATSLREDPDFVFLFIGLGARRAEVAAVIHARNLTNVRLLPPEPREGLAVSLAAADAHCVTLRPEYAQYVYPSKLAGVLAAGRPVLFVGPAEGDIPRLLKDANCGAGIVPGDAGNLVATIRRWQADPGLRRTLGANARSAYAATFTHNAALASWYAALQQARNAE